MYTLKITKQQAEIISEALEVYARLGTGQWRDAIDVMPLKKDRDWENFHRDKDTISSLLSSHMIDAVDGCWSSLSISDSKVRDGAKITWDIHQGMRHRLAWVRAVEEGIIPSVDSPRKWPEMMQVYYDDPSQVGPEPLAEMVQEG